MKWNLNGLQRYLSVIFDESQQEIKLKNNLHLSIFCAYAANKQTPSTFYDGHTSPSPTQVRDNVTKFVFLSYHQNGMSYIGRDSFTS